MSDTMEITTAAPPMASSVSQVEASHVTEGHVIAEGEAGNIPSQQMESGEDSVSFADSIFEKAKVDGVDSALESLVNEDDSEDVGKTSEGERPEESPPHPKIEFGNDAKPLTIEDINQMALDLRSKIEEAIEKGGIPSLDLLLALSSIENMSEVLKKLLEKKKDEEDEASDNIILGLFNILSSILKVMMDEDKYLPKDRNQSKPEMKILPVLPSSKLS